MSRLKANLDSPHLTAQLHLLDLLRHTLPPGSTTGMSSTLTTTLKHAVKLRIPLEVLDADNLQEVFLHVPITVLMVILTNKFMSRQLVSTVRTVLSWQDWDFQHTLEAITVLGSMLRFMIRLVSTLKGGSGVSLLDTSTVRLFGFGFR